MLPVSAEADAQITTILDRSWAFHGRIAGPQQIQLSPGFSHNQSWVEQFSRWWRYGFDSWRRRADENAELTFLCELGPRPYAMLGPDGEELSDRWQDSLWMRDLVRGLWR